MKLVKHDSNRDMFPARAFRSALDRLFSDFFTDDWLTPSESIREWTPHLDVVEEKENWLVKADLPGIDEKDLNVELRDNLLTISGKREEEKKSNEDGYQRIERRSGSFQRTVTLPEGTDASKIQAAYNKGVLTLTIPKAPQSQPKKITVKSS